MIATLTFCKQPWVKHRFGIDQSATVGRAANCELIIRDSRIALRQFVLVNRGTTCVLKPCSEANTVYVNGMRFDNGELHDGSLIEVQNHSFSLKLEASSKPAPSTKRRLKNLAGRQSFKKLVPEEKFDFDPYVSLGRCGLGADGQEILHPVRTIRLVDGDTPKNTVNS